MIAAGEHPKTIQTRLGHSSIQVTMDRYGHLMEGLDDRTADHLDDIARFAQGRDEAQANSQGDGEYDGNPLTRGKKWQSRPDSNRRFRLERPIQGDSGERR